jgi:predicted phage tail protein
MLSPDFPNQEFQKSRYDLEEVRKLWRREPDDNRVFRAATEDIEEYPPEIQTIIKEEAEQRRKVIQQEHELAGGHQKARWLKYSWTGVFGFLFFMGAAAMGASLPIKALMLAVGIVVGSMVETIVKGLKKEKQRKKELVEKSPKDNPEEIKRIMQSQIDRFFSDQKPQDK